MAPGVMAGVIYDPVESAGLYIPGGRAAYPSTVLMTAIPAKVAGVRNVVVCSPPARDGKIPNVILAAARIAGVDRVFKAGGAQAIAAMAYGTETIPPVEKIFGPGNIYVTAAKFAVSRDVAIDLPAGPSDVLIYAECEGGDVNKWVASDMLAQSEHDPMARSLLVTPSRKLAESVNRLIEEWEGEKSRGGVLEKSLKEGAIILVRDRDEGLRAINSIAPEHLQLFCGGEDDMIRRVRNAGAVFMGEYSPVALGDYTAGTNHVLPTMGWSRRASPLSVRDFLRSREYLRCTKGGLESIGRDAIAMAEAEGLKRHAESIRIRL
jgi:histidinol dehydrogenase